jgi:hypothetical protein
VIDAFPLASVVDVLALVVPLPAEVNQLTVTFAADAPPNSTWTVVASAVPIGAVRSRNVESAERAYGVGLLLPPVPSPVDAGLFEPQAVAATKGKAI